MRARERAPHAHSGGRKWWKRPFSEHTTPPRLHLWASTSRLCQKTLNSPPSPHLFSISFFILFHVFFCILIYSLRLISAEFSGDTFNLTYSSFFSFSLAHLLFFLTSSFLAQFFSLFETRYPTGFICMCVYLGTSFALRVSGTVCL